MIGLANSLRLLAATALALPLVAQAAEKTSAFPFTQHFIYTESGGADNVIYGWVRDDAGNLTAVPGAPFAAGGSGIVTAMADNTPFDNDQSVTVDHVHNLLFAVNSASNTVAVFFINPFDGSLSPVLGSPFPSGGISPISIGVRGDQVVIVNQDQDPSQVVAGSTANIVTRHIAPNGALFALPSDTTFPLPAGTAPTQALVANDGPFVFNLNLEDTLDSWQLQPNGELRANPAQSLPLAEFGNDPVLGKDVSVGLWANPVARQLYVGFSTANKIGVYTWDDLGFLTFERTVPNSGLIICWLRTNRDGTRLYTTNDGLEGVAPQTLSVYDTTDPANPVEIQTVVANGPGQLFQLEIDPTGLFIYAISERANDPDPHGVGNTLHVFAIDQKDGTLTEVSSSPIVLNPGSDVRPQGIGVF